ncbi:MAG: hypothetical protein V1861_06140 [Candidatus Micrarchaeota archaeon]
MGTARSLIIAALGAASISYGAYEFNARYSREAIFERQQVMIEHVCRAESAATVKETAERANSRRAQRLQTLETGLSALGDASIKERCEFEAIFERQLLATGRAPREFSVPVTFEHSQSQFPQCSMESMVKDTTTVVTSLVGLSALLLGLYNLLKRKPSHLGKEVDKRVKAMENERKDALLAYGIPPAFAHTITLESVRAQSAYELHMCVHSTRMLLQVLENYGFSKGDIQRILLCFPPLLNKSPEALRHRLSELEENGIRTQQEVMAAVVKLPGILGQ